MQMRKMMRRKMYRRKMRRRSMRRRRIRRRRRMWKRRRLRMTMRDDGKEPQTISQEEMVHTSADDIDTMVANQPSVLPEQRQEMREHTSR